MNREYVYLAALLLCIAVLSSPGFTLDPSLDIHQYDLAVYTTDNGLPQSSVLTVLQTSDGFLWMGTYEGLARFDGLHFKIFDSSTTPEIISNRIRCILEAQDKALWIGTSRGLLRYSNGIFKRISIPGNPANPSILALSEGSDGTLWIATADHLVRFANGGFSNYPLQHGPSRHYTTSLLADSEGNTWIGTSDGGLHIYRPPLAGISHLNINNLPPNIDIRVIYSDAQNRIWIGTRSDGLIIAEDGEFRIFPQNNGFHGIDIRAIFQDSRGTLWIGTNGQGLYSYKNGTLTSSHSKHGLLNSPIRAITEDREGSLWIGTRDGLSQLMDGKFITYRTWNGLPVDSIRSVFQDSKNNIWLGTVNGGLAKFANGSFKPFGPHQGLKNNHIWSIAEANIRDANSLWIGTYGGGLHRLVNDKITDVITTADGLSNNVIRAIFVDADNNTWVGTNGGGIDVITAHSLSLGSSPIKRPIDITKFNTKNGLSDDFVFSIQGDCNDITWVGTLYGHLNCINLKTREITVFGPESGLTNHAVWSIYPDKSSPGVIWLGTDGGGLVRFQEGNLRRYTARDGLLSNLAFAVFEDFHGNLWMNCNKGIYSVKKKDLEDFSAGLLERIPCRSFGKAEGIKNTECNGPAQPAGLCSQDGKLWFPTIQGAVVIDPTNIRTNKTVPLVVIEELLADGKTLFSYPQPSIQRSNITVPAGMKRFEFFFTGLSFVSPAHVKFKYKLEGFDDQWMKADTQRHVSYTNISPGDYTFRVRACNNDGLWNELGTDLPFHFSAHFWQTWWFQSLSLIAFALLSYLTIGFVKTHLRLIAFWKKKTHIASYAIDEQIGSGGMGIVYKAHSLIDRNQTYALKVMKDEHTIDTAQHKRFKYEMMLVDSLDHPNIVKVHERGEDKGKLYIAMEFLEGESLAQRFKTYRYPSVKEAVKIMAQMAHILVHFHNENIIHRDLKPDNIMLIHKDNNPNFVKLLDFGIARVQNTSHLTESGQVLGTIPYMPPEVIANAELSLKVDIYSLGIIGYEMLTGARPFTGDKPLQTLSQILSHTPPTPLSLNKDIPVPLSNLIIRMIAKEADERPNAREVLAQLAHLIQEHIPKK